MIAKASNPSSIATASLLALASLLSGCALSDDGEDIALEPTMLDGEAWPEIFHPRAPRTVRERMTPHGLVRYDVVDGEAVIEGDMRMGPVAEFEARLELGDMTFRGAGRDCHLWNEMPVKYSFDGSTSASMRIAIEEALDRLVEESDADISFAKCSGLCLGSHLRFKFEAGNGCSSHVGRYTWPLVNGIDLDTGCDGINDNTTHRTQEVGRIMHEIMHALGVYHEQSRCDRDDFVTIHWESIADGADHNFDEHCSDTTDYGAYDYSSIMHYPATAFSIDGSPTITAANPAAQSTMGQRSGLSIGDKAVLIGLYGSQIGWGEWDEPSTPDCDDTACAESCGGHGMGFCSPDFCVCY